MQWCSRKQIFLGVGGALAGHLELQLDSMNRRESRRYEEGWGIVVTEVFKRRDETQERIRGDAVVSIYLRDVVPLSFCDMTIRCRQGAGICRVTSFMQYVSLLAYLCCATSTE